MGGTVYRINKGINRSVEFKGLKAQYIWWVGGGMVVLLVLFVFLYILGVTMYLCLGLILCGGAGWVAYVYKLSGRYGEHGMMKAAAGRKVPEVLKSGGLRMFIKNR